MYKVLLVDDEEVIREGMTKIIDWEAIGFRFMGAAQNGIEAYERLMQDPADIVITDLKMPVIDGLELIAKIQEEHPEIVFVVLSGYGEFELAKQAMRYGVKHYLLKPCNEQKIIEVLNEIKDDLLREEAKEQQFIQENREH
ncbi:MAG TPA: DNA-binding response regulator, partial [Firmicutes bacterium]|nr:DNA-binding response regulator [Bacillota bacterium]